MLSQDPSQIKMHATSSSHATLASTLVLQPVLNADGALVEPSITIKLETLPSNAVASRQDSHMLSLAQLSSELPIAVDSLATGLPINAMPPKAANSQTWLLATRLALSNQFTRSVIRPRRNAKLAKWEILDATLPPSARPPATNLTLSVTKLQANVDHATQPKTRTAQKLQQPVAKHAKSPIPNPNVITAPESAHHAKTDKDALTQRHVMQLARKYHQTKLIPATGPLLHQHANKIQREPLTRKHALNNAMEQPLVSVTSKPANALTVLKALIQNVSTPWITAKKQIRKNKSARLRPSQAYSE